MRLDKRIEGLNFLRGLLGPRSVGLMKGKQARERRQLLHNLFTTQKLDVLVPHFVRCIRQELSTWSSPSPSSSSSRFEAQEACRTVWMKLNALNIFGPAYVKDNTLTGLGQVEESALSLTEKFGEALALLLAERYNPLPPLPFSTRYTKRKAVLASVHAGVDVIISTHLKRREEEGGGVDGSLARGGDLLSMLLTEHERNPKEFTAQDVHDEMVGNLSSTSFEPPRPPLPF